MDTYEHLDSKETSVNVDNVEHHEVCATLIIIDDMSSVL